MTRAFCRHTSFADTEKDEILCLVSGYGRKKRKRGRESGGEMDEKEIHRDREQKRKKKESLGPPFYQSTV